VNLRHFLAGLALLSFVLGPGCDDPPAVAGSDAGSISEKVEALRENVQAKSDQMRESLKPVLDDVSVPTKPDVGPSN
jgi:hypothetical protein